ncbi:hypothetical protein AB0H28_05500 [Micromonospora sp. NPDC050980]|uniref:hypothetical protein n=1 Tax=Micromonospora sp. NPDC050980 TaxID=3155161 RepID=UPI003411C528
MSSHYSSPNAADRPRTAGRSGLVRTLKVALAIGLLLPATVVVSSPASAAAGDPYRIDFRGSSACGLLPCKPGAETDKAFDRARAAAQDLMKAHEVQHHADCESLSTTKGTRPSPGSSSPWYDFTIKARCKSVSLGYYVVRSANLGVVSTPSVELGRISSNGGQAQLTLTVTKAVQRSATLTTGLSVQAISAQLGFTNSSTTTVSASCTVSVNSICTAVLIGTPYSQVIEYRLYERFLGGGTGNDRYVGTGQLSVPQANGMHCQLSYL